jgi:tRNA nucleotidyltransferase (CCA-adding enzyme)
MDSVLQALGRAVPEEVRTISRVLREQGFRSWIVGGSVRDVVLAEKRALPTEKRGDWDMCSDATPEQVSKLFRKVIPTGIEHGTVTIVLSGQHFEVTTLRGERGHSDGRRPDEVFYVQDLNEDLARRDFTVNAMAYDIEGQTFHDPFGGRSDLDRGLLRAVGDPLLRFSEDGLRVLRCARFASSLKFEVEEKTAKAIRPSLQSFEKVAQERVRDEWFKALTTAEPSRFLRVIKEHGLLSVTLPEVFPEGSASSDAFSEAVAQVDAAPADPLLRLAIFLSLGASAGDRSAFFASVPGRLRLSRAEGTRLKVMLQEGRAPEDLLRRPDAPGTRRWLHKVGREFAEDVLTVQHFIGAPENAQGLLRWHALARAELSSGAPLTMKDLALSGSDLINEAGVPKGPELGRILALLLERVLEEPSQNDREQLLSLAKRLSLP